MDSRVDTNPEVKDQVSCVLCAYGDAPFLSEQLSSIAAQTVPVNHLLICDDGLLGEGVDVVRDWESRLPISYVRNDRRKGLVCNFSEGLAACAARYTFLCDQDDVWKPDKVERVVRRFEEDDQPDLVFSDAELIDETGDGIAASLWQRNGFEPEAIAGSSDFFLDC